MEMGRSDATRRALDPEGCGLGPDHRRAEQPRVPTRLDPEIRSDLGRCPRRGERLSVWTDQRSPSRPRQLLEDGRGFVEVIRLCHLVGELTMEVGPIRKPLDQLPQNGGGVFDIPRLNQLPRSQFIQ